MEFLPLIILPYVLGGFISALSVEGWAWPNNMSLGETVIRVITWPLWLVIFLIRGFFEALKNEFS